MTASLPDPCDYCGHAHFGACPRLKKITYDGGMGVIKSVEFFARLREQYCTLCGSEDNPCWCAGDPKD